MNYYYADPSNQPIGPITEEQLHALARSGSITPDTHVLAEGMTEWGQYRSIAPPPLPPGMTTMQPLHGAPVSQPTPPPAAKPSQMSGKTKGCLGCAGILVVGFIALMIFGTIGSNSLKKEFAENKQQILNQVKTAADAGDHARVIELADKFRSTHDPELDAYLDAAHAAVNAAKEKVRAERAAKAEADAIAKAAREKEDRAKAPPEPASAPPPAQAANEPIVTFEELDAIYDIDSTTTELQKKEAWKRYKGKRVTWSGSVSEVGETFGTLQLQIKMKDDTLTSDLLISLKRSEREKALKLKEGDPVKFTGILDDWGTIMPITLNEGQILNTP